MHTCAPPRDEHPKTQATWICPRCGSVWEVVAEGGSGIFDFDRSEVVTRAEWILVEPAPALLAG
jgi:hypothetical protein